MNYIQKIKTISNDIKKEFRLRYNLKFFDFEDNLNDKGFKGRHIYTLGKTREYIFINCFEHTWMEEWLKPANILEDFINTLLHEIGHHLDYTNDIVKSKKEYFAHCFVKYVKGEKISKSMKKTIDKYIDVSKLKTIIRKYKED